MYDSSFPRWDPPQTVDVFKVTLHENILVELLVRKAQESEGFPLPAKKNPNVSTAPRRLVEQDSQINHTYRSQGLTPPLCAVRPS